VCRKVAVGEDVDLEVSNITCQTGLHAEYDPMTVSHVHVQSVGRDGRAEGYSGADLAALVREAGLNVLRALRRG
jgi:SpoVK/Ycf46/Vps4 family AAA+-type ATPase